MPIGFMGVYFLWLLAAVTSTAVHFVWISYAMKKRHGLGSLAMLGFSHLIAAGCLAFTAEGQLISILSGFSLFMPVAMVGFLMWITRLLYYYAYSKAPVGQVAILSTLTPLISLFFAWAAGYAISARELLGVLLISGAVYAYFCSRQPSEGSLLLSPVKAVLKSRALQFALLSTIPPALAIVFHKQAVETADPVTVAFWICFIIGLCTLPVIASRPPSTFGGKDAGYVLVAGVLQAGMVLSISYFLQLAHPSAAQALLRIAILLQIVLAYFVLKETFSVRQHLLASIVAIFGVYLIVSAYSG